LSALNAVLKKKFSAGQPFRLAISYTVSVPLKLSVQLTWPGYPMSS
jgi:hypothetical protein